MAFVLIRSPHPSPGGDTFSAGEGFICVCVYKRGVEEVAPYNSKRIHTVGANFVRPFGLRKTIPQSALLTAPFTQGSLFCSHIHYKPSPAGNSRKRRRALQASIEGDHVVVDEESIVRAH